MYKVKVYVHNNEYEYECSDDIDILTEARKKFIRIPAGCRRGGCGMCKVKIVQGDFVKGLCSRAVLSEEDEKNNFTLACKTFPRSDIIVRIEKRA